MDLVFPRESADYRAARNLLLKREIELCQATEAVAEARRALPAGGEVPQDDIFSTLGPDGLPTLMPMSGLVGNGKDTFTHYSQS